MVNTTKDLVVYKLAFPFEDANPYLAFKVAYDLEDNALSRREYWFRYSAKQSATYTSISGHNKQAVIKKSLAQVVGTLVLQE